MRKEYFQTNFMKPELPQYQSQIIFFNQANIPYDHRLNNSYWNINKSNI